LSRESLLLLAEFFGIDPEYQTIWGHRHQATPKVLRAALQAVSGGAIPERAYSDRDHASDWVRTCQLGRWLPSPVLAEDVSLPLASVRLPGIPVGAAVHLQVLWEDGTSANWTSNVTGDNQVDEPAGLRSVARPGYHQLTIQCAGRSEVYSWILSPSRVWSGEPPGVRAFGLSCFLPCLRSARNWGCGDFRDLVAFAREFRAQGFSFLALNPLNALANRTPYNVSPYSPLSLLRLNLIYAAVEELPEFHRSELAQRELRSPDTQARLRQLRELPTVDYEGVAALKLWFFRVLYREFLRHPSGDFASWRQSRQPWLDQFGAYLAFWRYFHKRNPSAWTWRDWPADYHSATSPASIALAAQLRPEIDFHAWVQWKLEQQLAATATEVKSLGYSHGLYCDLPVACDQAGPDRWANPLLFAQGIRVGSPPDDFNPNGQDWGFPALRPVTHCPDVISYFRECIRSVARSAGIIRLDHVMRLARLYSIPNGASARDGVYIRDQFLALLRVIAIESVRLRTLVVGEDLGTVPEYFRSALDQFGILSYRLVMFEWHGSELKPAERYPTNALCSFSTHDLPTFDGYLQGRDIELRRLLGALDDGAAQSSWAERRRNLQALVKAFSVPETQAANSDLFAPLSRFLLSTPSQLVLISFEELCGEDQQMNLPGTTSEYPNWRHKTKFAVEQIATSPIIQSRLAMWRAALELNLARARAAIETQSS
jgi:4-alpha-glucanotransferase